MATHSPSVNSDSDGTVTLDIGTKIEWACTRLRATVLDEKAARESLEDLLKRKREDAREAVIKAQNRLILVKEEEKKIRRNLVEQGLLKEQVWKS